MGLTLKHIFRGSVLVSLLLPALAAAPKLRLSSAVVGPVPQAEGAAGASQVVEAWNAGDGTLSLNAATASPWLTASTGPVRACTTRQGACIPINIGLATGSLSKGMYTGVVTVTDPNAVDAPQTITVTVQIGGAVPDRADLFVAPNGRPAVVPFYTNSGVLGAVSTVSGGNWLSLSVDALGSFGFAVTYRITGQPQAGMAEGNYDGKLKITGAAYAPDNKDVTAVLHVTSQPIVDAAPAKLALRAAQQGPKLVRYVQFANRGSGTLEVGSVTASVPAGQNWLSVDTSSAPYYKFTIDPAGLAPGLYQGGVAFASNAANGVVTVPVEVEIVPQGGPWSYFGGVVNNATFARDDAVSQGDICALFGEQLSYEDPATGTQFPLVQQLGKATVYVNDHATPLYYSSYGQMNFQMPYEIAAGEALVRVDRESQRGNTISVKVVERAARILRLGVAEYGIVVNNKDGSFPIPTAVAAQAGLNGHPAQAGDALVLYLVGMGQTQPPVASGAKVALPPAPLSWVQPQPRALFGGKSETDVFFAGLTPGFVGLYQVNVYVPAKPPKGDAVSIALIEDGSVVSNRVDIAIQ